LGVKGQNLVPNPSFEDTIRCPFSLGDYDAASSWTSYANSSDYFNRCHTTVTSSGVPSNWYGFQQPNSGDAYYGMITYSGSGSYREILGANLITPLVIGQKYYASVSVCMANCGMSGGDGANKLGFLFTNINYNISNPVPINNFAHIYSDSIVTDTLNWIRLIGSFIADSSYTNFAFGNFYEDSNTDTITDCGVGVSYYYIDDLAISTDSTDAYNYIYTGIEENSFEDQINIYPNPANNHINITKENDIDDLSITIYNTIGQILYSEQEINSNSSQIDISNISNGLLFIKIESDNNSFTYKLLKH
jgi:hypothetical protein